MHPDGDVCPVPDRGNEPVHDILLVLAHLVHEDHDGSNAGEVAVFHEVSFPFFGYQHAFAAQFGIAFHDGFPGDACPYHHAVNGWKSGLRREFSAPDPPFHIVHKLPVKRSETPGGEMIFAVHIIARPSSFPGGGSGWRNSLRF